MNQVNQDSVTEQEWAEMLANTPPADRRHFRLCWFGAGVMVQETDGIESFLVNHGPYKDAKQAMAAIRAILEGKPGPEPYKGRAA
ncbi:MAG: hypothetical protein ABW089_14785 [Sedimenticola sp.]